MQGVNTDMLLVSTRAATQHKKEVPSDWQLFSDAKTAAHEDGNQDDGSARAAVCSGSWSEHTYASEVTGRMPEQHPAGQSPDWRYSRVKDVQFTYGSFQYRCIARACNFGISLVSIAVMQHLPGGASKH